MLSRKNLVRVLFLCLLSPVNVYSFQCLGTADRLKNLLRTSNGTTKVDIYNKLADLYYKCDFVGDSSYHCATQAYVLSKKINYEEGMGYALHRLGRIHHVQHDFDRALENYIAAKEIGEKTNNFSLVATSLNSIGLLYKNFNNPSDARKYFAKSIKISEEICDESILANVYLNLGRLELDFYHNRMLALDYFHKCLNIGNNSDNFQIIGEANLSIGIAYMYLYSFEMCIAYFNKALEIFRVEYGTNHSTVGMMFNYIGYAYINIGDYKNAEIALSKARNILQRTPENPYLISVYDHLGDLNFFNNNYEASLAFYRKSLAANQKLHTRCDPTIRRAWMRIGNVFKSQRDYSMALNFYNKCIYDCGPKKFDETTLKCYRKIGEIYHAKKEFNKAIIYYQKSICNNSFTFNNEDANINPTSKDEFFIDREMLFTLKEKAQTFLDIYETGHAGISILDNAIETFQFCDTLLRTIRKAQLNKSDRLWFFDLNEDIYSGLITSFSLRYNIDNQSIKKAFYFSESSKANVLLESLGKKSAQKNSHVHKEMVVKETDLQEEINNCQSQYFKAIEIKDSSNIYAFKNKIFELKKKQNELREEIKSNYPRYFNLKYEQNIAPISSIQGVLKSDEALIEYFLGRENIFIFLISKSELRQIVIPKDNILLDINSFTESILNQNADDFFKLSHILFGQLIEPVYDFVSQYNHLIIIPDGQLWKVNFDLLIKSSNGKIDYQNADYLLKSYAISYDYSATTLLQQINLTNKVDTKKKRVLAFSYNNENDKLTLFNHLPLGKLRNSKVEIPGTSSEIKAISQFFSGEYYFGSLANERLFKKLVPDYSIVHLAIHGHVDNEQPDRSGLYFKSSNDSLEDDILYAFEIYNLPISAELITLSACNSGSGKIVGGEGAISLGHAFAYAGAGSLLLSKWEITDAVSPLIMKYFYANLKQGFAKDEALQLAKLNYLKTSDNISSNPFHWGAFYLIGDTEPIYHQNNLTLQVCAFIGVVGIILILTLSLKKKKIRLSK